MENEEQHTEPLIPVNTDVADSNLRRMRNPWSFGGALQRLRVKWRTARMKRVLNTLGTHQGKDSMTSLGKTKLEPPWITMPGYPKQSMTWRMGEGRNVALKFRKRYKSLSEAAKEIFRRYHPEPKGWDGYYNLRSAIGRKGTLPSNKELVCTSMITLEDLPDVDDRAGIVSFARSFVGYEYYGSFSACADVADLRTRSSLEEVRNELFFAYRAGSHTGNSNTIIHAYTELLPYFKKMLS